MVRTGEQIKPCRPDDQARTDLSASKTVAQRSAIAHHGVRAKFVIVVDQIEPHFGANEDVVPDVSTDASSEVPHKVVAAGIAGASEEVIAIGEPVESDVFAANSRQQFSCKILAQLRGPDSIEGVEHRAIGLGSAIQILAGSPGQFTLKPEAMT